MRTIWLVVAFVALALVGCGNASDKSKKEPGDTTKTVTPPPAAEQVAAPAPAPASQPKAGATTVVIRNGEEGYSGCEDVATDGDRAEENLLDDRKERGLGLFGDENGNWTFIRFNDLKVPAGKKVAQAQLVVVVNKKAGGDTARVAVHRLISRLDFSKLSFKYRDVDKKETWGDGKTSCPPQAKIDYQEPAECVVDAKNTEEGKELTFDITRAVRDWVRDPATNTGIVLRPFPDEKIGWLESTQQALELRPKLVITLEP
jgi:hypothetical protein